MIDFLTLFVPFVVVVLLLKMQSKQLLDLRIRYDSLAERHKEQSQNLLALTLNYHDHLRDLHREDR